MASRWGREFLVNTIIANDQSEPAITALADGRFVIAWRDLSGGSNEIRAQVFNTDGSKAGGEFLVNTTTAAAQREPTIAVLADGGFIVAWTDESETGGDTSDSAVRAQVFDADGSKASGELLVNTTTNLLQQTPTVAALADGRFVVAWTDGSQFGVSRFDIRAQVFNPDGSKAGGEIPVATTTLGDQLVPTVTALTDGRFVVAWSDESETGGDIDDFAVRAQIFNGDGSKAGGEILVNTTTDNDQFIQAITALTDGGFVVAWTDDSQDGGDASAWAVHAQVVNANGTKSGSELLVNTTTSGEQGLPTIAALADGRFVVAWSDNSQSGGDTSGTAVRAQVFNADGSKSGSEFLVNITTSDDQTAPTIAVLPDGRFVVAWGDHSQTGGDVSGIAVRAQIFDPRKEAIDLKGGDLDDQFAGTGFDDTIRGAKGSDLLLGDPGNDLLKGGKGNDTLFGDEGKDKLKGGKGKDELHGGDGKDKLKGGAGKDELHAGEGGDKLWGNGGRDTFVFADALTGDATRIKDFKPGKDKICLDQAVFAAIGDTLTQSELRKGSSARDDNDYIIYKNGGLYYDPDGKGGEGKILFARVNKGTDLSADDFLMI